MLPLGLFAISGPDYAALASDTLLLIPRQEGRELIILEGDPLYLKLSDGSSISGTLEGIAEDYVVIDRQKIYLNEIVSLGLEPMTEAKPKKKRRFLGIAAGAVLAIFGIRAISNGGIDGILESPSGSGPLGELVGLIFWILGLVVLGVTVLVVGGFAILLLLSLIGIGAGVPASRMSKKKQGKTYDIGKEYKIETRLAK